MDRVLYVSQHSLSLYWNRLRSFMYTVLIHAFCICKAYGYDTGRSCRQCMINRQYHQPYGLYCFQHGLKQKTPLQAGLSLYLGFVALYKLPGNMIRPALMI
jgi:hypothetical protein